jgi:cyclopropane fatty-acyl-phospholipid synthase-like methyltransferase
MRPLLSAVVAVAITTAALTAQGTAQRHRRLFPPENLGMLEAPDRATWQKPDLIMDALNIADGSRTADIGAGSGWFTIHLAQQVGPRGIVYAEDVQPQMLEAIKRRVQREGLRNVEVRLGSAASANLPVGALDAVLVVDTYPEVEVDDRVVFLRNLAGALKPAGRIGIVNYTPGRGGPGPDEGRVDSASVEADARAAGLRVIARQNLPYQYLLVLGR